MSPGPPSTAPSTRWPGPPYNDYAVRWWTVRAIWLGRPEPVLGDLGRHAIDPAWRRRHRTPAPERAWADGYAGRDGRWWPRSDPQNVDPVTGRSLRERWEIWDRLTLRTDLILAEGPPSTPGRARRPTTRLHSAKPPARRLAGYVRMRSNGPGRSIPTAGADRAWGGRCPLARSRVTGSGRPRARPPTPAVSPRPPSRFAVSSPVSVPARPRCHWRAATGPATPQHSRRAGPRRGPTTEGAPRHLAEEQVNHVHSAPTSPGRRALAVILAIIGVLAIIAGILYVAGAANSLHFMVGSVGDRSRVRRRNDVSGGAHPKFHPSASVTTVTGDLSGRRPGADDVRVRTFLLQR